MKLKLNKSLLILQTSSLLALSGCALFTGDSSKITLSSASETTGVNQPVAIEVKTSPTDQIVGYNAFSATGGELSLNNGVLQFSADKPGTYEISASQNDVTSNVLSIEVTGTSAGSSENNDSQNDSVLTISEFLVSPDNYTENPVTLSGFVSASAQDLGYGEPVYVLYNDDQSAYVVLDGDLNNISNASALVTGTISNNGYDYVLTIENIQAN